MKDIYVNTSDGSIYTLKEHKTFTPDEEWQELGFKSVDEYFNFLIDNRHLVICSSAMEGAA